MIFCDFSLVSSVLIFYLKEESFYFMIYFSSSISTLYALSFMFYFFNSSISILFLLVDSLRISFVFYLFYFLSVSKDAFIADFSSYNLLTFSRLTLMSSCWISLYFFSFMFYSLHSSNFFFQYSRLILVY